MRRSTHVTAASHIIGLDAIPQHGYILDIETRGRRKDGKLDRANISTNTRQPMIQDKTAEDAVLSAIRALSPHASWADIVRLSGVPRHEVKALLDPLEDRGLIKPWHWHNGKAMECINDNC